MAPKRKTKTAPQADLSGQLRQPRTKPRPNPPNERSIRAVLSYHIAPAMDDVAVIRDMRQQVSTTVTQGDLSMK
ncbi:uncharacterized protein BDW43DRAFT_293289 [Aspergillus alliaceus]|uniref:uncharacterized protein n=1 Tax=Petromyces alliaceus TaxID=209559 RepID=UPI0012A77BEB|nr:uncharacterized protein BDW43DRAFT_293289 [Aspergillus alliaceus]KAB8227747.1 hypothetical protein BDW43DRAFT_293289 [Aspergillus alliaceus]